MCMFFFFFLKFSFGGGGGGGATSYQDYQKNNKNIFRQNTLNHNYVQNCHTILYNLLYNIISFVTKYIMSHRAD